ncbi:hypothetical protein ACRN9C_08745 [Shewanella frigidimarina]|uniref:hypothetical protein n=1 Tax=Shewanella frigidimarina TaxID=56812 RepID=UPI003D7A3F38
MEFITSRLSVPITHVQKHFIRQTLYQLDQSIQNLIKANNTDRAELDNLHNVYHNLIRQFTSL